MSTVLDNRTASLPTALRGLTKPIIIGVSLLGLAAGGWMISRSSMFSRQPTTSSGDFLTYEVTPRDLPITIIERGSLESQTNIPIYCEVDDVRSDGINGTPIVWIIESGSSVKKGDLICELDSSAIQAELDEQLLDTEEARSAHVQAKANLENQEIQNTTAQDKAVLDVRLAELELEMFEDADVGSGKLELELIKRQIDDLNNEIMAARMNRELRFNEKQGIETLFKLGYAGKSELDRSKLSYLQAEADYAAKLNKLDTQQASADKLERFDQEMQRLELEGKVRTCQQALKQVQLTNRARLAQMQGVFTSRTEQLTKEEERLERYRTQLAKCKIYAPQDGMVAYATPRSSRDSEIAEGLPVRPRQHILSIPNLESMQVRTQVHESALDRVEIGQVVEVAVDAFPDRTYQARVKSVAVLPQSRSYSDTKTYETVIEIEERVEQLKPGMTAVCDIKVDYLHDALAVPIQAIVQRSGVNWLYVDQNQSITKTEVNLGASNDQYVSVLSGIAPGARVILNPGQLLTEDDTSEEDVNRVATEDASVIASVGSNSIK
ncbi:MAG TPA: hypothetical protein DDW52_11195 [Planctomycetaceae bacterium]|nr:hypothetical protein [Planctomycetaceae bacterium]